MSKVTEKIASLFHLKRPVSKETAADISDWVNEGGASDPDGPPAVRTSDKQG